MKHKLGLLSTIAALVVIVSACGGGSKTSTGNSRSTTSSNVAVMACDASFENIMQQEIDIFEYINPKMSILPYYIDEAACVDSLLYSRARLAVISRELNSTETNYLKSHGRAPHTTRIAVDAIALIVNNDNPLNELTVGELREVLSGQFKAWKDIQPSPLGDISVVFDHQGSSTVRYMRDSLLNGSQFAPNVYAQGDNKAVFEAVRNNKNALGIIGVSWISSDMKGANQTSAAQRAARLEQNDTTTIDFNADVKVLRVRRDDQFDSFKPYQAYILDGSYPLYRSMYMVNTGVTGTAAHGFYVFVTSWRGQKVIQSTGVLPATVRPRVVSLN